MVAKTGDGTVQITLTIAWKRVEAEIKKAALDLGKKVEVPGFRKGKAPIGQVMKHVSRDKLVEKALGTILPTMFGEEIKKNKIKPAIYPKFEIIKAKDGEDWEIRAITCELPEIKLGDYKKDIKGVLHSKAIWTPDSPDGPEGGKEPTKEEKEQKALEALLSSNQGISIPKVLVDQEVDSKLASLLERLEKLGLSLESYLASIGKTPQDLRKEYGEQAERAIKLELILEKIADSEKITAQETEVAEFVKMDKKLDNPSQKRVVASIIRRRKAIDMLASL